MGMFFYWPPTFNAFVSRFRAEKHLSRRSLSRWKDSRSSFDLQRGTVALDVEYHSMWLKLRLLLCLLILCTLIVLHKGLWHGSLEWPLGELELHWRRWLRRSRRRTFLTFGDPGWRWPWTKTILRLRNHHCRRRRRRTPCRIVVVWKLNNLLLKYCLSLPSLRFSELPMFRVKLITLLWGDMLRERGKPAIDGTGRRRLITRSTLTATLSVVRVQWSREGVSLLCRRSWFWIWITQRCLSLLRVCLLLRAKGALLNVVAASAVKCFFLHRWWSR